MDWEKAPQKVTEKNLAGFMDLGSLVDTEDPTRNMAMLETEMARPNLPPEAKSALKEEHARLTSQIDNLKWEKGSVKQPDLKWEKSGGPAVPFKSGSAFDETSKMIPGIDDIKGAWDTFQKQWANRANTPMTSDDMTKMMHDEKTAGAGVLDTIGAIPAMALGVIHGAWDGLGSGDATKGLKTAGETTSKLLPSSLLPASMVGDSPQESEGYKTAMAPITTAMDVLNAVPQGYGEILNTAGAPNAAAQVTDTGKLAIQAAAAAAGVHGVMKGFKGKAKVEPGAKLEAIAKRIEEEQKAKESPKEPTAAEILSTQAHADDFGVINPYDVAGHVSEAQEGRAPTIDDPQGNLFGGESLQDAQPGPDMGQASISHDSLPYEKTSPLALEPKTELPTRLQEMGKDLNQYDRPYGSELSLTPRPEDAPVAPEAPKPIVEGTKPQEQAAYEKSLADQQAKKMSDIEAAHAELARMKQGDFGRMEGQKELDFAKAIDEVTNGAGPARRAFVDRANLDFQEAKNSGDKSLMGPEHTIAMRGQLRMGDVAGALKTLADNHPNPAYRQLARWMADKIDNLKVVLHPESIVQMGERDVTGYYDPTTHTVGLSGLGATSPHTVLHELAHALSSKFMNDRPSDVRVTNMKGLFDLLGKDGKLAKEFPGIVNPKEFLAEAMSNPTFQKFLKDQRMNGRTVWQRFVDNVRSMLGLEKNSVPANALEHALDLSQQIIEAQTGKGAALEQFKKAGLPSKLSDLMASAPNDTRPEVINNGNMRDVVGKVTGLAKIKEQFDFTPKPPEEVAEMAKTTPDIPAGNLETLRANLDSGGLMASLRHNNNPIIKYTFAYVDHALKMYDKAVRDNITNKSNGVKTLLQALPKDDFSVLHSLMMLDEGQRVRTSTELASLGFSEKMINAYNRIREVSDKLLKDINDTRAMLNPPLPPIEARMGHLAGRFMGDFSHMVLDEHGNAVMRISGSTKWGAQKLADFIQKEHPEWNVGKQEYQNIKAASSSADRFNGFRELMNYVGKNDPVVGKALDTLDRYNRAAATKYLDVQRHAKDKLAQAGGLIGSEGNKAWLDVQTNAEQGFKAQMAFLDNSYKWIEMQKAMESVSKVTNDTDVIAQQPNAIKWATAYTDHALHRNQGFLADFANSLLSEVGRVSGIGHTNLKKAVNWTSSAEMRNWMGIGNIPFALKHMLLPFQKMPAMMTYLKTVGQAEGSLVAAGASSLHSYYKYLRGEDDLTPFQKEAFQFAKENNVFNVDLADTSGKIQSSKAARMFGKFSDLDFSAPEHAIRGTSFFFYAHLLEDSGMDSAASLSAAEHLSKFLYTDYGQHEAPRGAAKGGWIGQLALQITRYKANEVGQMGFFNRERIPMSDTEHTAMQKVMSNAPLMAHVGSLLAFTGVTGMLAFKEMDQIYSLWMKYVHGQPDNLTSVLQRTNAPDLVKYGVSSLIGIDSKISEAQLLPSPFPTTTAEISQLGLAFDAARYHDTFHAKKLALGLSPSTARGYMENHMFTQPKETTGPNAGKSLYLNPNTGMGRFARTDEQMSLRNIGFHSTAETNELEDNYSKTRIMQDNADLATHVLEKAKGLLASGVQPQEVANRLAPEYMKHVQAHQPDFATALVAYMQSQHEDQKTQMLLRQTRDKLGNSLKIVTGKQ